MFSLAAIIKSLFTNVHKNSIAIAVNLCYNNNILKNKEKFSKPERCFIMNRIIKVGGVEIVLNGHSVFQSTRENWYDFVPLPFFREAAAEIHVNFTNPFDFIFDNINKLYKAGIVRDTTIEIEKSYEEGDFYAVQFHCDDGAYNETRTAICFNDFKAACEWVDKHNDERYEIVPQKFGHEFVNYWD